MGGLRNQYGFGLLACVETKPFKEYKADRNLLSTQYSVYKLGILPILTDPVKTKALIGGTSHICGLVGHTYMVHSIR